MNERPNGFDTMTAIMRGGPCDGRTQTHLTGTDSVVFVKPLPGGGIITYTSAGCNADEGLVYFDFVDES